MGRNWEWNEKSKLEMKWGWSGKRKDSWKRVGSSGEDTW